MSENPQLESDASDVHVSRETQETSVTPEQALLNEIMDRTMDKFQAAPKEKSEQEAPIQGKSLPSEEKEATHSPPKKNKSASTFIYLAVLFGAAFLMLLLAYFVQQRNNAFDASKEKLLENINKLEEESKQLQTDLKSQTARADQAEQDSENYKQILTYSQEYYETLAHKAQAATFLWYLDQFMDAGDYPMAAAAAWYSGSILQSPYENNPTQMEQYREYLQELVERGYLQQLGPQH